MDNREDTPDQVALMLKLKNYMKAHKIRIIDMAKEVGYTPVHISLILNGHTKASDRCKRDIIAYLARYSLKNYNELKTTLEGSAWPTLFLHL